MIIKCDGMNEEDIKNLIIGDWKLHKDEMMNALQKFSFKYDDIELDGSIINIKEADEPLDIELELLAVNEKCLVLRNYPDDVIYVLLRIF